jgi:hypothetical protein
VSAASDLSSTKVYVPVREYRYTRLGSASTRAGAPTASSVHDSAAGSVSLENEADSTPDAPMAVPKRRLDDGDVMLPRSAPWKSST